MLTEQQIAINAEVIVKLIEKYVTSDRKEKILQMLEKIGTQYYTAPASGSLSKHSAFAGGLVKHTILVAKSMLEICSLWYKDVNLESAVICALFHDLGKAATVKGEDVYVDNDSQWHKDKLGKAYIKNPIIRDGLTHSQRGVRLLTHYGIDLTDDEYLAILAHNYLNKEENISFKYKMNKLENTYKNCNYQKKDKSENSTIEVLITNY